MRLESLGWRYGALILLGVVMSACSSKHFSQTVAKVDLPRFMGKWYVITGRTTGFEKAAHNAVEIYTWNEARQRIDIDFTFRKGGFDGKPKSLPQKAWIINHDSNAHWKVSPFWPLRFDYLVVALADDYSWTAIGVPNQKYLWIMARQPELSSETLHNILAELSKLGYNTANLTPVPQQW